MTAIVVQHVTEQHGYVAQQRCACGGEFDVESWELQRVATGWHEVAHARCTSCGKQHDFAFDITQALDAGAANPDAYAFGGAWPEPFEGPYGLRRLDYKKQSSLIQSAAESGEMTPADAEQRIRVLVDETYPIINGRYQVFGARKGSMGFSYLCSTRGWTPDSPRPPFVVCKCLGTSQDGEIQVDEVTLQSMIREADVWARLGRHPNVVRLFDVLQLSPTNLVLVLEAVLPGPAGRTTLRDWIDSDELTWPLALRLARDLCSGMLHCARQVEHFVHGDLKPSNLLVDVPGGYRLKITDFGLSYGCGLDHPEIVQSLGTPMYRAPECWQGGQRSPASDVYAIGLILFEMATGRHPFRGLTDSKDIEHRHVAGISVKLEELHGAKGLNQIIRRSLSVDPNKRPSLRDIAQSIGLEDSHNHPDEGEGALEWNDKGTALIALGKHAEAIECYVQALSLAPNTPGVWSNLALSFSKCGLRHQAERAYQICLRLPDAGSDTYANYAAHVIRYGGGQRLSEAIAHCERAIALDSECVTAWINKAAALNSIGNHREAAEAAQVARRLSPASSHALIELATAYWKLGKRHQSWKLCDRILHIDPAFEPARHLKRMVRKTSR